MFQLIKKAALGVGGSGGEAKKAAIPTIISADMNILGNMISEGPLDMAGKLNGNVTCHSLTVRDGGCITGEVDATNVTVYGHVKGIIRADNVVLYSTARIEGIVMHKAITIEDGAFIDGSCKRTDKTPDSSNLLEHHEGNTIDMLENLRLITA